MRRDPRRERQGAGIRAPRAVGYAPQQHKHLAAHPANPWWWKVLRLGPRSSWARAFDVDWNPPKRELRETVLLPVLGDH